MSDRVRLLSGDLRAPTPPPIRLPGRLLQSVQRSLDPGAQIRSREANQLLERVDLRELRGYLLPDVIGDPPGDVLTL